MLKVVSQQKQGDHCRNVVDINAECKCLLEVIRCLHELKFDKSVDRLSEFLNVFDLIFYFNFEIPYQKSF